MSNLTTSLRGAQRRSNPSIPVRRRGLLPPSLKLRRTSRFAGNDGCESGGSLRLLRQRRMRPAEVGRSRILADLDDAAADGAGAGEVLEQRFAVVAADG